MKKRKNSRYEEVGAISVDAGIIQIGDPCYGNLDEFKKHSEWLRFLDQNKMLVDKDVGPVVSVSHSGKGEYGGASKAIICQSGFGDGIYPIYIKKDAKTGLVKELKIRFF